MAKPYVIIAHKNVKEKLIDIPYDYKYVEQTSSQLNSVVNEVSNNMLSSQPFKKFMKIVSNVAPPNKVGNVPKAITEILTTGKVSNRLIENDLLKYSEPVLRGTAQKLGYPTFNDLYSRIKFGGTGMSAEERKSFINSIADASQEHEKKLIRQYNENHKQKETINGIIISLITSIDEEYESEVPLKKVEAGYDIATSVYNKNESFSFSGFITDVQDNYSVEDIKAELIAIRNSKITFDMEFKNSNREPLKDCLFTSISFSQSDKGVNGYDISFSVMPVKKGKVDIQKTKFTGTAKVNSGKKNTSIKPSGNNKNPKNSQKQTNSSNQSNKPKEKNVWSVLGLGNEAQGIRAVFLRAGQK